MSNLIWLNYSSVEYPSENRLMLNYIYLLQRHHIVDPNDEQALKDLITQGKLLKLLEDDTQHMHFADPIIREILLEAYPYEVELKFLWSTDIQDDVERNERIITLFNKLFAIDYHEIMSTYTHADQLHAQETTKLAHDEWLYDDITTAKDQYVHFVKTLLTDQWYTKEVKFFWEFCDHLVMKVTPGISGVTSRQWDDIVIEVGNNTYTTLFHELTHAVNSFFRFDFYESKYTCDHSTKTNEWLSNFIAYHCYPQIVSGEIEAVEEMNLEQLFFSMYIDIYKSVGEKASRRVDEKKALWENWVWYISKESKKVVFEQLKKFEWELLSDEKAEFYYQRFYKFFHYDQATYFYPKEMMYYLGYRGVLDLFRSSQHKKQLLAECLLGKVCL